MNPGIRNSMSSVYGGDVVSIPRAGIVYVLGAGIAQPGGYVVQSHGDQITVLKVGRSGARPHRVCESRFCRYHANESCYGPKGRNPDSHSKDREAACRGRSDDVERCSLYPGQYRKEGALEGCAGSIGYRFGHRDISRTVLVGQESKSMFDLNYETSGLNGRSAQTGFSRSKNRRTA